MATFYDTTTRAGLELVGDAERLTSFPVELGIDDRDGCEILIGDLCSVYTAHATSSFELTIPDMPGKEWCFHSLECAVRAADLIEVTFVAVREAANASRQTQGVA